MTENWILSCESTTDIPYAEMAERNIPVLFYTYSVDGVVYEDNMGRDPEALQAFYGRLRAGALPKTSQLNEYDYTVYLDRLLQKGNVLHLCFGSGMTGSVFNAERAAEELRAKYPDRKLAVLDSTCSCLGYGLLTEMTADLKAQGASMEEAENFVLENRLKVRHDFFTTDLSFFRRSGRMSGPAAMFGAILNICPMLKLNRAGRIIAYGKVRGKKAAFREILSRMEKHAENGKAYSGKCLISHADCPADAAEMKRMIEERFPALSGKVRIYPIGTIIASHCGPGTLTVYYMGDEREE